MHTSLSSSQGVVETESVDSICDEGIQSDFLEQCVLKVCRLIKKTSDKPSPL
jgi:aspartyl aminopeptidase